jgi:hypothetical protein
MLTRLCRDILETFQSGIKGNNRELFDKSYKLSNYFATYPATPESLGSILELERTIIGTKGPHKQFVEEHIFRALSTSALYCAPDSDIKKRLTLDQHLQEATASIQDKQRYILALKLVAFSEEVFSLNRPRDSFKSERKCLALELLERVEAYYDVPEYMALIISALASAKKSLVLTAVESYERYLRKRDVSLAPEVLVLLEDIVQKTKDRSIAVAALHLQVASGGISEMGALSEIDDWKERNGY